MNKLVKYTLKIIYWLDYFFRTYSWVQTRNASGFGRK